MSCSQENGATGTHRKGRKGYKRKHLSRKRKGNSVHGSRYNTITKLYCVGVQHVETCGRYFVGALQFVDKVEFT